MTALVTAKKTIATINTRKLLDAGCSAFGLFGMLGSEVDLFIPAVGAVISGHEGV